MGKIMMGFLKGVLITVLAFTVGLVILRGCVAVLDAQEIQDVRINENDRTIEGLNFPNDISGTMRDLERANIELQSEQSTMDVVEAIKALEMRLVDWDTYAFCLQFNEGIYKIATEAGDTGLELSPKFEVHLKDCWRALP